MSKVLITGGTGFLGSYLIKYLVDRGDQVRGLKRESSRMHLLGDYAKKVEWVEGDILDIFSIDEAMQGIDRVYHSAAMISFLPKERDKMMKINVEGTSNMVNHALQHQVKKFLHVSSISAFGRTKADREIDETADWIDGKQNTNYAISKFLAEQEVWRAQAEGLDSVIVNPATVLGAGDWRNGPGMIFSRVWEGLKFYTTGSNGFVDVRDVVRIMVQLMDSDITNERFILSAENWRFQDLFTLIARELKLPPPTIKAGPFLTEIAWRMETLKSWLTGKDPIITKETARMTSKHFHYKNDKIKKVMNVRFRPLEDTVQETCRSFLDSKEHNKDFAVFY